MYLVRFFSAVSVNGQEEVSASKSILVNTIKEAKAELEAELATREMQLTLNNAKRVKDITASLVQTKRQNGVLVGAAYREGYKAYLTVYHIPN